MWPRIVTVFCMHVKSQDVEILNFYDSLRVIGKIKLNT